MVIIIPKASNNIPIILFLTNTLLFNNLTGNITRVLLNGM